MLSYRFERKRNGNLTWRSVDLEEYTERYFVWSYRKCTWLFQHHSHWFSVFYRSVCLPTICSMKWQKEKKSNWWNCTWKLEVFSRVWILNFVFSISKWKWKLWVRYGASLDNREKYLYASWFKIQKSKLFFFFQK